MADEGKRIEDTPVGPLVTECSKLHPPGPK
jgi:hypothetical protein